MGFILKGKIQDLIDSRSISLPEDSIKAPVNQVWGGDWTVFERKGAKKRHEHVIVAIEIRKAIRAAGKERKLLKIEAKKNIRAAWKRFSKKQTNQEQLVQQSPVPLTLEEYIQGEWFEMIEEEEEEEEEVISC